MSRPSQAHLLRDHSLLDLSALTVRLLLICLRERYSMALNKRMRDRLRAHCGELHEDDGVYPREFFKPATLARKENHKAKQICRQAAEVLDLTFAGEACDNLFTDLRVVWVVPAPDSSRLLVTVYADVPPEEFDAAQIQDRLTACKGRLRAAVAAAVTRRRAPDLAFNVIGPMLAEEGTR
jgi:ribosome-binding factor A